MAELSLGCYLRLDYGQTHLSSDVYRLAGDVHSAYKPLDCLTLVEVMNKGSAVRFDLEFWADLHSFLHTLTTGPEKCRKYRWLR